jgi:hypothetical protein
MGGCRAPAFGLDARHTRRSDPESTAGAGAAAAIPHLTMHACARPFRACPPRGEDSRPPIRAPASALRRARPPPSDGGRAPHTALRAPPWAFTQHIVSTNVLSSPRGIGILAQSPRRDQRGRRATHASDPPTHTSHPQGTNAARLQSRQSQSSNSSSLSAAAPVEGGRVGNQWAAAEHPPSDPRGPDHPTGGR